MRRVVVTGLGIISSIGSGSQEVLESLRIGKSGIVFSDVYRDYNFRSHVHGAFKEPSTSPIPRDMLRFMGKGSILAYHAMQEAITDASLSAEDISNDMCGLIIGSGGPSTQDLMTAWDLVREKGAQRVSPLLVPRTMSSAVSANMAVAFGVKGFTCSLSSACATSAHCIGAAYDMIRTGQQTVMFAGGSEELNWNLSVLFDAMLALSSKYNDCPEKASRPYDADRDGFVIAGGAGILVLEDYEFAIKRGAPIYAEIAGYGFSSDGADMVRPSGEGATRCMKRALKDIRSVDYINTHGTSTKVGDLKEIEAMKLIFSEDMPYFSSTKSMTGHSLGAAGVQEAIYCLLMMKHSFMAPSINIENLDADFLGLPIVREATDKKLCTVLSNNFGFGGTNASIVFQAI